MAGINTRLMVTNSDGLAQYMAIRTFDDHLTITDESTDRVMTIAFTMSVSGDNNGDQTAAEVPMDTVIGADGTNVQAAMASVGGSLVDIGNEIDGIAADVENIGADVTAIKAVPYLTTTANSTTTNEFALGSLATGILRNTTTTGIPVIAVASDFPTLNQDTTGSAAKLGGYPLSVSGARFRAIAQVMNDGAMDIGKYLDFHETNDDTSDYSVRIYSVSNVCHVSSGVQIAGGFGCNGNSPQAKYTVNAAATDAATTMTLVNQLRLLLIANGQAV